jgi:quinol monooxygenase YgiN
MLKVVAKMVLKPGVLETVKKDIEALQTATRNEVGCISYDFLQDVNNQDVCFLIEEWESQEALNNHMNTEHFKKFGAIAAGIVAEEPQLSICTPLV